MLKKIIENPFTLLNFNDDDFNVYISTAEDNMDFKTGNKNFDKNIAKLKEVLKLDDVCYLKQTHSADVFVNDRYHGEVEGDALITSERNVAIGVFTADCVPILIWDKQNKVVAAVHSGWKGTFNNIVGKTIRRLIDEYSCDTSNLKAIIGPHIKSCCYEVDENLISKFKALEIFKDVKINNGRYLDLQKCVEVELINRGVNRENIFLSQYCTHCEEKLKLHSYRKEKENAGRLFSVIYFN